MAEGFGSFGGGGSSGFGGFGGGGKRRSRPSSKKGGGGNVVTKFIGNLAGDVKDSVVGIPGGVKLLATDPGRAIKTMAESTWATWSPLFRGDFAKFGHAVYDHPLAPLLDVATVFTLGAGGVARGASAVAKAGNAGRTTKFAASLIEPKRIELKDPTGVRHTVHKNLSTRAGRRLGQEALLALEPHLPRWVAGPMERTRFEARFAADMAHRVAAKNLMATTVLQAGKALSDPETAPRARQELAAGLYLNLHRHAPLELDPVEAKAFMRQNRHYRYVVDAAYIDRQAALELRRVRRKEARWDRHREENAELANSIPQIREELEHLNRQLAELREKGHIVATKASNSRRPGAKQLMENEARPLVWLQNRIKDTEARLEKARSAKKIHDQATSELGGLKATRMDLERRSYAEYFRKAGESDEAFERFVNDFGRVAVTRNANLAARTAEGKVRIVPKHDAFNLGEEAKNSSAFVKWAFQEPTRWWKMALLGYTPRIVTNNAIGNWAIYVGREGGDPASVAALGDAVRLVHGDDVAAKSLQRAIPFKKDNWLFRYFGDELGNTFMRELDVVGTPSKRQRLREGFYPIVHKLADEPVRVASIAAFLRRDPTVRALQAQGLSFDKAALRALRRDRGLRERAVEHARATAGDYVTIRNWERPLRAVMPFYLWNRHILRTMGSTLADTPGRVAIGQRLSQAGVEETEKILGDLPEFLRGALPLGKPGKDGRADVLLTHSLNPFATIGELASMAEAGLTGGGARPGASLLGQTHPFITGTFEFASGTSLLTGAPKPRQGGLPTSILASLGLSLPQIAAGKALVTEDTTQTQSGSEALYAKDDRSPLTSLFGVPLRDVSLQRAAEMAAQERGGKRKRKRRKKKKSQFGTFS